MSDLRTATLEPSDKPILASGDCTLTGETAKAPNGEDAKSFRDADRAAFDATLSTANRCAIVALAAWPLVGLELAEFFGEHGGSSVGRWRRSSLSC